jgi:hypothetical protein
MLTDNQNKLLEDLRREFSKMNTPTKAVGGGLINRAEIDNRLNESAKRKAELNCITDATEKAVLELMDIDMERLNYDLIPMGIIAQRNANNKFFVRIDGIDKQDRDLYIQFQYRMVRAYEDLSDRSGCTFYTGFHSIEFSDYRFESIDKVCQYDRFTRNIEDMYKLIKNKNKCK